MRPSPIGFYNYNAYANQFLAHPTSDKNVIPNIGINDIIKEYNYKLTKKISRIDLYA